MFFLTDRGVDFDVFFSHAASCVKPRLDLLRCDTSACCNNAASRDSLPFQIRFAGKEDPKMPENASRMIKRLVLKWRNLGYESFCAQNLTLLPRGANYAIIPEPAGRRGSVVTKH